MLDQSEPNVSTRDAPETAMPARTHSLVKVRRFLIVVNPDAGGERKRFVAHIAATLTESGRDVIVEEATLPGRIYELAASACVDALLIAGGDGSLNEAVRGLLARAAPRPILGVIPQGTVNVLAQELNLPRAPEALARIFLAGKTALLHVGLANGRPFALMASAGLDAAVVRAVDRGLKQKIGRLAYLVALAKTLMLGGFADVDVETEAGALRAKCVVVAKSKYYGGRFVIDAGVDATRPGLSLIALRDISAASLVALAGYFITGRTDRAGHVRKLSVRRVTLGGANVAAQIDGDYCGEAPLEICESVETLAVFV